MRFSKLALIASAVVLGACGGGDKSGTPTDSATTAASATAASTTPAAGADTACSPEARGAGRGREQPAGCGSSRAAAVLDEARPLRAAVTAWISPADAAGAVLKESRPEDGG